MATEQKTATAAAPAAGSAAAAAAAAPAKAAKPKAEPKPPRYLPTSTLNFKKKPDSDITYGPVTDEAKKTVNPKRAGTKAHTAFSQYEQGITIAKLEEKMKTAGVALNANLDWDIKHGFIEIVPAK